VPKNHSHLTTEQFSALLDQQLSAQEQSLCQAHLTTCDSCQQQLAELQQTVLLVRGLPQAPLPRSFVLPIESTTQNIAVTEQDTSTPQIARLVHNRGLRLPRYIHTTMRITSALVAILGLFFTLSGLLTIVLPNAENSRVASSFVISRKIRVPASSPKTNQVQPLTGTAASSPHVPQAPILAGQAASSSNIPLPQSFTGTAPSTSSNSHPELPAGPANAQTSGPSPSTPQQISLSSLGTPEGHLSLGLLLFIAGIVSSIVFTRLGKQVWEE
jgi:anti-sigma factor RsiW